MAPEFALVVACIHSGRNGARFPCAQAVASDLVDERALAQVRRQQDQAIGFARVGAVVHQAAHAAHRRPQQPHFAISALAGRRHHFRMQALRGTSFHVIGEAQACQQHIRVRPCGLHRRDDAAGAQGRDVVAASGQYHDQSGGRRTGRDQRLRYRRARISPTRQARAQQRRRGEQNQRQQDPARDAHGASTCRCSASSGSSSSSSCMKDCRTFSEYPRCVCAIRPSWPMMNMLGSAVTP